jgi:PAS domain S-box-containing protein
MLEWLSGENRVRIFLGLLILVLVIVNSQSLHLSFGSRSLLLESIANSVQSQSRSLSQQIRAMRDRESSDLIPSRFEELARQWDLRSLCLLDWNGRLLVGSESCVLSSSVVFDRLDRQGKRLLVERGWAVTKVAPPYDPLLASVFGYRVVPNNESGVETILRMEVPTPNLAAANLNLRSTLFYQVSAFALVLLTLIFFLNRLLAPHRRLVSEARTVAGRLDSEAEPLDEEQFLLSTFQGVVAQLKDKEQQLEEMHAREKARADETEALATDIIRSMTTGLVSLDENGRLVLMNPAAETIFRTQAHSVLRRPYPEVLPGSEKMVGWVEKALQDGEPTPRGQVDYRFPDGDTIHLGVSIIPLFSSARQVRGALCLHADLTEVIRLRERLTLKDNLARLGEMTAGIAHEFRNGLATILGNAKLLESATSEEETSELVEALLDETQSLSQVVTQFLQFARPQSIRLARVDLEFLAGEIAEELAVRASEAQVRLEVLGSSCRAEVDEVLVRQAVQNLVLNAIEAAAESPPGRVEVRTAESGPYALLTVSDSGPGIPKENVSQLFMPFFTTKPGGTGLGLALVQKIAVAHNGEVSVSSTKTGACLTLRLPLHADSTTDMTTWV